ncbi:transcriptional regulator, XRE family [Syntrophothermus lipocalidus DSM 12680]|uniref:Transcriptional regulator, XRE family n=1 Tax=Syntrophothermus lipocalidus (strain DSM 12680 / TGB-C1) TaxID=643648 RepID=D7CPF6_SYNLT|nr:transcriptional regulator, XRE family [Syntrophothermus lipocalidus DSM 12680]
MTSVGSRIKQLREERGLTQEQLGKILNVQKAAISKYEKGHTLPDSEALKKLAKFFNVSVDYLLCLTDTREPFDTKVTANVSYESAEKSSRGITNNVKRSFIDMLKDNRGMMPSETLLGLLIVIPAVILALLEKLANVADEEKGRLVSDLETTLREAMDSALTKDIIDISDLDEEMKQDALQYIEWLRTKQKLNPKHDETSAGLEDLDKDKRKAEGE